jgi:hypothetical protein
VSCTCELWNRGLHCNLAEVCRAGAEEALQQRLVWVEPKHDEIYVNRRCRSNQVQRRLEGLTEECCSVVPPRVVPVEEVCEMMWLDARTGVLLSRTVTMKPEECDASEQTPGHDRTAAPSWNCYKPFWSGGAEGGWRYRLGAGGNPWGSLETSA